MDVTQELFSRYSRPVSEEQLCLNESIAAEPIIGVHSHDFMELTYIRKGNAVHVTNGTRISISEGDLFLLSYGCEHTFEEYSHDFTWTNCLFLPRIFGDEYEESPFLNDLYRISYFKKAFDFHANEIQHIHLFHTDESFGAALQDMMREYYNAYPGYYTICRNMLANLLIKIGRTYMQVSHCALKSSQSELVGIVYDYFRLTSSFHKVRLEDIAQRVYMNPDYLGKLFKKKVGINISTFIRNIRLETAARYLRETNMNVCAIMRFVGYQDTKNF